MQATELLITVNFTALVNPSTAYIFLGTDEIGVDTLRSNALPFPLNPGGHFHGYAIQEFRQTFDYPSTAFWGVLSVRDTNQNISVKTNLYHWN